MPHGEKNSKAKVNQPIIAIIGAGNVGSALARLMAMYGYSVTLGTRKIDLKEKRQLVDSGNKGEKLYITNYIDALKNANCVLITVPDEALLKSASYLEKYLPENAAVGHCSGVLTSDVLVSTKNFGRSVASLHPLNTFPSKESAIETLKDKNHQTRLYCEGDSKALDCFLPIFERIGFIPKTINKTSKPLYHAACVFACNLLTALMESSLETAELAQIDRDELWESLQPLVSRTLANINEKGTAAALSGPVVRGDYRTIEHHIKLLEAKQPILATAYKSLSMQAINLAEQRGSTDQDTLQKMRIVTQ